MKLFMVLYLKSHKISIPLDLVISLLKIENNYQRPKDIVMKMSTAATLALKGKIGNELNVHP